MFLIRLGFHNMEQYLSQLGTTNQMSGQDYLTQIRVVQVLKSAWEDNCLFDCIHIIVTHLYVLYML